MANVYAIDWNIGAHISFAQRITPTVKEGINCGMYTIQFFMGNPQSCKRQRITDKDIKETQFFTNKFPMFIYSHFPYIANFAGKSGKDGLAWNGNEVVDGFLSTILKELEYELYVLSQIGHGVVIHPGSYPDREKGHLTVAKSMNRVYFPKGSMVLLENCAGEGNKLCRNFEEIKLILDNIDDDKREYVGVCVDTAHIWGQGDYDISKISEVDRMFNDFTSIIGLEHFKLLHLNDSEVPLGAKKDRHACLGRGYIWGESFDSLIYLLDKCKQLKIPMVLETKGSDMFTLAKLCEDREEDMVCPVCINCAPKIVICPCCK
tara:strand:+ start:711 stop:1667 length:957 start_codon:yes stop_codon:yes gene_type:complete